MSQYMQQNWPLYFLGMCETTTFEEKTSNTKANQG